MGAVKSFDSQGVSGFLHIPTHPLGRGLVLTHGAGANSNSLLLQSVAQAFAGAGWHALRYDLPFRQKRKSGPPHPSQAAEDREGLRAACCALAAESGTSAAVGGHSYGGRQASMLLADDPGAACGLLLLSYPLHPPDQPAKLRTQHFPALQTPALFVHGTADPFGSPDELGQAVEAIPGRHALLLIEGAKHDLKQGRFDLFSLVVEPFAALLFE